MSSFVYARPVRFEEVDAAGIVFFARFLGYGHEAMESFFGALAGGYHGIVMDRRIGFPAVHVDADYAAPLRFGERMQIVLDVTKIGTTSCTFRYRIYRDESSAEAEARVLVATVHHTCVCCELAGPSKVPFPEDVRALLEAHLCAESDGRH